MNRMMLVILIFSSVFVSAQGLPLNCNNGPIYWCLNAETAEKCGVTEYCKIMNAGKTENDKLVNTAAPPINVSLYYESLCPGCRNLIKTQIFPTYLALKSTRILNILLYPYGNAHEYQNGTKWMFTCQHGEEECLINLVETCALHLLTPPKKLPFIHCIENSPSLYYGRICAEQLGIEWAPIAKCYMGSEGNYLEHQMAVETKSLDPPHQYVPWLTVNGVHTDTIQTAVSDDMLKYVCSIYAGAKPAACNTIVVSEQHRKRVEACYKD